MTEKEKAISILKKMPICVECDASVATFTCVQCENAFATAIEALKQPDIVRCKDCEFGHHMLNDDDSRGRPVYVCEEFSLGQDNGVFHYGDWFCAGGKRKEKHDDQSIRSGS